MTQNISQALDQFKASWKNAIDLLGSDFGLIHGTGAPVTIRGHFVDAKHDNENLVNATDIDTKLLVTNYTGDISKFDLITDITNSEYSVRAPHKVIVSNDHVGWKVVIKS
jgi:hypothetical protein